VAKGTSLDRADGRAAVAAADMHRCPVAENELLGRYTYTAEDLLECEFYLLEELDCCITVFHPYRPLVQYGRPRASGRRGACHR